MLLVLSKNKYAYNAHNTTRMELYIGDISTFKSLI